MNKKLSRACRLLEEGASLAVVNSAGELTYAEHGIKTLLSLQIGSLTGAFVADKIVGKAAAMMLVRGGALEVYAGIISVPALEVFEKHKIPCVYGKLVPKIINREGTGDCPMEQAVLGISDISEAYSVLIAKTGLKV